jgi:hypothetical protein
MQRGQVDLRTCKPGDILISAHGAVLVYEGLDAVPGNFYPHLVKFIQCTGNMFVGTGGSRTNDGYTWQREDLREEEDHDIVLIIPRELIESLGISGETE